MILSNYQTHVGKGAKRSGESVHSLVSVKQIRSKGGTLRMQMYFNIKTDRKVKGRRSETERGSVSCEWMLMKSGFGNLLF